MDFGIVPVAAITVICCLAAQTAKAIEIDHKWLPVICGVLGGALGIAALAISLASFPASDPLTAAAVGIVSGLAATGAHQIVKQFSE